MRKNTAWCTHPGAVLPMFFSTPDTGEASQCRHQPLLTHCTEFHRDTSSSICPSINLHAKAKPGPFGGVGTGMGCGCSFWLLTALTVPSLSFWVASFSGHSAVFLTDVSPPHEAYANSLHCWISLHINCSSLFKLYFCF